MIIKKGNKPKFTKVDYYMNKILLTGGSGLLGKEILKINPEILVPNHEEFDITNYKQMLDYINSSPPEIIIHAGAFTSPPLIDQDPMKAINVNIIGTSNIVLICSTFNIKLIYISTDYVFKGNKGNYRENDELLPQNHYAWSKLGGECAVRIYSNSLIIRTSFCESIFPYDKAFVDQYTSRDSVDVIAPIIFKLSNMKDIKGIIHVGTKKKSVKELAIKLGKKNVGDLYRKDVSFHAPKDTSLNIEKLKS